jgi:hypothetical protein
MIISVAGRMRDTHFRGSDSDMAIDYPTEQWLQTAGYEHHCFISWPHTISKELTECARRLKTAIEQQLALSIPRPRVFLDETGITGGAQWENAMKQALCRSITMVAVCAPIYYHPDHRWCGLEWAAMQSLSRSRLPNEDFTTIIPVIIRKSDSMPRAVSAIQYIDFSNVTIRARRYYTTQEFRSKTSEIVERIEEIARALVRNRSRTGCKDFDFPTEPAFSDYAAPAKRFPASVSFWPFWRQIGGELCQPNLQPVRYYSEWLLR